MAFNNFPYADFQDLNLDWLLKKTLKALAEAENAEARVKIMENLLKVSTVKTIMRELLQEMVEDGSLANELIIALADLRAFTSSDHGWSVIKVFDRLIMDNRYYFGEVNTYWENGIQMQTSANYPDTLEATDLVVMPLDMPMERANDSNSVTFDSYGLEAMNISIHSNGCRLSYRPFTRNQSVVAGQYLKPAVYMQVCGQRKEPRSTPIVASRTDAIKQEIIDTVDSYYAQRNATDGWSYGNNFVTYSNSTIVRDSSGHRRMECDTLVALVFLGLEYSDTPYSTSATSFDFTDLPTNPHSYSWALPWAYDNILHRKVTWTGGINWWLWDNNKVFKNASSVEDGDIVIFRKPAQYRYFDNISHIGICRIVNGAIWVYHFSGSGLVPTGENMRYEPLSEIKSRESYADENVYFARP